MTKTSEIKLINCNITILEHVISGDKVLAKELNINIPNKWSEFGTGAFEYVLKKVSANPEDCKWWAYLPMLKHSNTLIGSCGYKGKADDNGRIEIGYEIALSYRNNGYATTVAQLYHLAMAEKKMLILN